ncbi:MAG: ATP-binding cassette domain-containing protein [Bacteroidota bacterium]|nr:ATP-binding cassette domain-containing protein [Bacteroidota bacterium]
MIAFQNVRYTYPGSKHEILSDATFGVAKGEFAVIKGMTGSGKSTILHLLACEARPEKGNIEVGEYELASIKRGDIPRYRRTIGCVFQDFKLLEEKTVAENIAFALEVQRKYKSDSIAKDVSEALDRVGMSEARSQFPRELSLGGVQRVAIARALVTEPRVLLADSITAQLDEETARSIYGLLASEHIRGMTILLTASSEQFFPVLPKTAKYFELQNGKVTSFLPSF